MKKKTITILTLVILLLAVSIVRHRQSEDPSSARQPSEPEMTRADVLETNANPEPAVTKANRPSPGSWTPPAVFAAIGKPTPQLKFVRGKNATRHYQDPQTRELADDLSDRAPTVLAKTPEDGRLFLLPEEIDLHTKLSRRMVFDPTALDSIVAGNTSRILAPTTGDEVLTLEINSVKTRSAQSYTLMGRVLGEEELSDVQLVYHDGIIHGTVARYTTAQHLEYRILADGHMMVRELDSTTMDSGCGNGDQIEGDQIEGDQIEGDQTEGECDHTDCNHDGHVDAEQLIEESVGEDMEITIQNEGSAEADTTGWTTVDVVVGYGQGARIADNGYAQIEARIIASIDRMTTAFVNSGITNTEMMLLGTIEDPNYVFGGSDAGSMSGELSDLRNESGSNPNLNAVTDYKIQLGADFSSFIVKQADGSAGLASRPGDSSITARDYMTTARITFAHELGHNLGCDHSWGDSSQSFKSNYGWRIDPDGAAPVRTIMAYDFAWGDRFIHFANPSVSFGGVPTGAVNGFDVRDETRADQRYLQGGYDTSSSGPDSSNLDPNLYGFDGTNAALGANNADGILNGTGGSTYGATYASNRKTRVTSAVISPSAGTSWSTGSTENVLFVGGDGSDLATIDLYRAGSKISTLQSGVNAATGRSYPWTLSAGLFTGSDYTIRVTLDHAGGGSTTIDSDFFSISGLASDSIELLSPNGGEDWIRSTVHDITWASSLGGNVKIELFKGGSFDSTVSASTSDDGSFVWTVSKDLTAGADYKIKITSIGNPTKFDESTSDFTVSSPSGNLLVANMDSDPGFTATGLFEYGTPASPNIVLAGKTGANICDTDLDGTCRTTSSLTTTAIDCSSHTSVNLEFWYHAYTTSTFTFEVSNDNSNWTELFSQTGSTTDAWQRGSYDISAIADGEPTVYVRWAFTGTNSQYSGAGLAIDDVQIVGNFIPADDIYLVSPDGGENLTREIPSQINWRSGMGGNVKIELYKADALHTTIATSTSNDGIYNVILPAGIPAASDYKIKITSVEQPSTSVVSTNNFSIIAPSTNVYTNNLDTDPGFTTTGLFEYGVPASPNRVLSGKTGANIYDTDLDGTCHTTSSLTTTAIDCSSHTSVNLEFWYHAYTTSTFTFEVSNDNSNWTELFSQTGSLTDAWQRGSYDISAIADGEPTVYVRWAFTGTNSQYFGAGLAIDDISITGTFSPTELSYGVSYDGNGNTGGTSPTDQIKEGGVDLTLATNSGSLVKSGSAFAGWNTAADGSGVDYAESGTFSADSSVTLYAKWIEPTYNTWAGGGAFTADANSDGIDNGIAWVLGASNSSVSAATLQPISDNITDASYFIYTYRRSDNAHSDADTTIAVEYGSALSGWTPAVHDGSDVVITETDDGYGAGVDKVEVKIDRTLDVDDKLFIRLTVTIAP